MNLRPLRYSLVLDLHPDYIPHVVDAKRKLKLREAILCSYHPNEVYTSFHLILFSFIYMYFIYFLKESCKILSIMKVIFQNSEEVFMVGSNFLDK